MGRRREILQYDSSFVLEFWFHGARFEILSLGIFVFENLFQIDILALTHFYQYVLFYMNASGQCLQMTSSDLGHQWCIYVSHLMRIIIGQASLKWGYLIFQSHSALTLGPIFIKWIYYTRMLVHKRWMVKIYWIYSSCLLKAPLNFSLHVFVFHIC